MTETSTSVFCLKASNHSFIAVHFDVSVFAAVLSWKRYTCREKFSFGFPGRLITDKENRISTYMISAFFELPGCLIAIQSIRKRPELLYQDN